MLSNTERSNCSEFLYQLITDSYRFSAELRNDSSISDSGDGTWDNAARTTEDRGEGSGDKEKVIRVIRISDFRLNEQFH